MTAGGGRSSQTSLQGGLNINQVQLKALYLHQGFPPTGLRGKPRSLVFIAVLRQQNEKDSVVSDMGPGP